MLEHRPLGDPEVAGEPSAGVAAGEPAQELGLPRGKGRDTPPLGLHAIAQLGHMGPEQGQQQAVPLREGSVALVPMQHEHLHTVNRAHSVESHAAK